MAIGVLILGESGTGKTYSVKNFSPEDVKILSVWKPILPFRMDKDNRFEIVKTPTGRDVIREMKNTKKKVIVVDDFQYIMGIPMMKRLNEKGWEKYGEIEQPYSDVLDALSSLPDDVIVYLNSHVMRDDDTGKVQIKTVGKALDKYITIEGMFQIVLGTHVSDGKYYFVTQNNGVNTLKSPEDMFPSLFIPNDLKYVDDKIRSYYYLDGAKTDDEMAKEDAEHTISNTDAKSRRARSKVTTETATSPQVAPEQAEPPKSGRTPRTSHKTHDEVVAENQQKVAEYMEMCDEVVAKAAGDKEEIPFEEAVAATEDIPQPEIETPPRRTRKERQAKAEQSTEPETLAEDTYFYIPEDDNYIMKHKGDVAPEGAKVITKEEFGEGVKCLAQQNNKTGDNPLDGAMNPPESGRRTRRGQAKAAEQTQPDTESGQDAAEAEQADAGTRTRRTRRTR